MTKEHYYFKMDDSESLYPLLSDRPRERRGKQSQQNRKPKRKCPPWNICIKSKASALLLTWSVLIGAIYISLLNSFSVLGYAVEYSDNYRPAIWAVLGAYALLALIHLFYPLSGFLADTYCGRYRAIMIGFITLLVAVLCLSTSAVIGFTQELKITGDVLRIAVPFTMLVVISLILITAGLAGYQANIIQFGLDQLIEAPSRDLGLFIHWLMWTHTVGGFVIHVLFAILPCHLSDDDPLHYHWVYTLASLPIIFLILIIFLLLFTCYNHEWFYTEPGQSNPYKMVYRVLNFARKNKYPLRRSAFTYCDDEIPSRIDFGKTRFGGPFTTEQVEDVKTFLRLVVVLVTLGPVFVLEVAASYYIFPYFTLHVSKEIEFRQKGCESITRWVILESGGLGYMVSIVFVPIYIWVVYSLLEKRIPKILHRLWCAFLTALVGVASLLVIDLIGHILYKSENPNKTGANCMFTINLGQTVENNVNSTLNIPSALNIIPSLILNPSILLVQITAFEFISAQSPLSMKGLLVGVYFTMKGLFQFLSAVAVVPFALQRIWVDRLGHNPPVTNCAFGYYLFTITTATVGLAVFTVVVKRYKYRQRDERPYDQRFAEQYYQRCISERIQNSNSTAEETERQNATDSEDYESSGYDYGATESDMELNQSARTTSSAMNRNGAWTRRLIN